MGLYELTRRLEDLESLDGASESLAGVAAKLFPHGPAKDLLSGAPLGHALHPVLTDLPIGLWLSASLLDLVGGEESAAAAQRLVGLGLAAAAPTAASGWSDWADTYGGERRVGLVHAVANVSAVALYSASLLARRRGRRGLGAMLGLAGAGATVVGGYLGGHLTMALGVGVDHTAFEHPPAGWHTVLADQDLGEGAPRKVEAEGTDVLLVRHAGRVYALANTCSHAGGPLNEGSLEDGCIRCPWHSSVFRLADGSVVHGPARSPQVAFDVRAEDGAIQVRARSS